jgi:hypothetical protein
LERDVLQQHDLVVAADFLEHARQVAGRVLGIAEAVFLPRAGNALRGIAEPFAVRIVAGPADQRAYRFLHFVRDRRLAARIVLVGTDQAAHGTRRFLFRLCLTRANRLPERKRLLPGIVAV